MSVQDQPLYDLFYVANKNQVVERVILGRLWMYITNCQLDWKARRFTIEVKFQPSRKGGLRMSKAKRDKAGSSKNRSFKAKTMEKG